ncbi:molybdenum-pterin-binding protein [Helicobacter sp. 16-1353]|uniref:winged helix-turn-helix domain-containing protein n=1 Tax=Helicobacter sp. 16-1353 TaxID=2004996 RepID=UPI000DCD2823|nr:LysR family transcriptional regulator [Helicobacter sp. 16-1353]RAX54867.1 molybdenum-pterin-binding protein [Helicobacter sp. 16-1353]
MEVYGRFWVKKDNKNYLGIGRVELLRGIIKTGSISSSAKTMRMSYKAAWDNIDAINNLSATPLVTSATGGKGGGGTKVTPAGLEAIEAFRELENAKEAFCAYLSDIESLEELKNKSLEIQKLLKK